MNKKWTICLSGSNHTGKSTLTKRLSEVLGPNIDCVIHSRPHEAALKLGYESAQKVPNNDEAQWNFQVHALFAQLKAQQSQSNNVQILDRSVWDFLAYTNYKMPWLKGTDKHRLYEQICEEFSEYDFLFYCPNFGEKPVDNGIRLLTPQEPVEEELMKIFRKFNVEYHHVRAVTLETRLEEVLKVLEGK